MPVQETAMSDHGPLTSKLVYLSDLVNTRHRLNLEPKGLRQRHGFGQEVSRAISVR
jgi:hypothetical protein